MREGPLAELFRATEAAQRQKEGDPGVHHAMNSVQAGATDAHDADRGDVRSPLGRRHAMKARRRLEHRLEIASGSP